MAKLRDKLLARVAEEPLWGHFLYKGAVTLLVAPSSAGKTIFTHRLAQRLSEGRSFLGMAPPKPVRVLHIDLESPSMAKQNILEVVPPPDAGWDTHEGTTSTEALYVLRNTDGYDLFIVDNLQMVLPTKDEKDNSEAILQMTFFTTMAKEKNVGVLLVYNTGKAASNPEHRRAPDDTYLARGASARVERADLVLNMVPEEEEENTYGLHLVKDRAGHKGESVIYQWAGDYDYTLLGHTYPALDREQVMVKAILKALAHGEPRERKDMYQEMGIERDTARERMANRALDMLLETGQITKLARGTYQLRP